MEEIFLVLYIISQDGQPNPENHPHALGPKTEAECEATQRLYARHFPRTKTEYVAICVPKSWLVDIPHVVVDAQS